MIHYRRLNDLAAAIYSVLPTIPADVLRAMLASLRVLAGQVEREVGRRNTT